MTRRGYRDMCRERIEKLGEYRFLIKPTLILACIYIIAISAILRANVLYVDDMVRTRWGYPGWEPFSRFLSNFLSEYLHGDRYLTDISPLTQIIAVLLIALAAVIAVYRITGQKEFFFWHYVAMIPMGLSPYILECLSYKYDSPYMALSVLFSVFPLLFSDGNPVFYLLSIIGCVLGMCTTYQASAGIFPMLVVIIGLVRWINGEKIGKVLKFYGISAVAYVLGLLVFRKFIMVEYIDYASTEVAASLSELISTVDFNYKRYIVYFLQDFKPEWIITIFIICVCFLCTAVYKSKQNKIATLILVPLAMLIMFLLSFGVYPFLARPLFVPRAMYGVGCFIAFLGIFAVTQTHRGYVAKITCFVLGWYFFVFSFTYGNALDTQADYTDFRIEEAIDDLVECEALAANERVTLQVTGTIGYAPAVEDMLEHFPLLEKLVPVTFGGISYWGEYQLRNYYNLPDMKYSDAYYEGTYTPPEGDFTVVADNYYHTIWEKEDYIWIELH